MKQLKKTKNIYFIGIKGVGMTMLAQFLVEAGHKVSGSDINDTFLTDKVLHREKISVFSPFAELNIPKKIDSIIYSSAFNKDNNLEMAHIFKNKLLFKDIQILSYAEALGQIFNDYYGVAVCGSHGKTTTSAWLGYVLWKAGKKPSVLVGSSVPQFGGSSLRGSSKYFVAEVDEYQNKLQYFMPQGVVLNNIDFDHPDFFQTKSAYTKVFADFVKKIPNNGFLVVNNSDKESKKIKQLCSAKVISYDLANSSFGIGADYLAYDCKSVSVWQSFSVSYLGASLGLFKIRLSGQHNIMNSLAVIAAARELKVPFVLIKKYLAEFKGTARRTQILGKYNGALIIDDYAHHPTEVRSTLDGLKKRYPDKKIITVFHPHTFTRTKALFTDFVESFSATDELIVLDIYGSARERQGGVSSQELVSAIDEFNKQKAIKKSVKLISTIPLVASYLRKNLQSGQLVVLMGAGDVFRVYDGLKKTN